jgi:Flp pilus assembly protein TadD
MSAIARLAAEAQQLTAAPANDRTAVPAAPSAETPGPAVDAPREPTAKELKQARSITARGHRYLRADRHETAAMAYLKALEIVPGYVPALTPLIGVYLDEANAPEACRWAEQLVAVAPNSGEAHLLLGDALEQSGDGGGADRASRRASELGNKLARKRLAGH